MPVVDGCKESRLINVNNGILQGDSYCPAHYVLTMNVNVVAYKSKGKIFDAQTDIP